MEKWRERGPRSEHKPDSGLESTAKSLLLPSGKGMSIWEAGGWMEADMQWKMPGKDKEDIARKKILALGCFEGLTSQGRAQNMVHLWESMAGSSGIAKESHAGHKEPSSGTSPICAPSGTRGSLETADAHQELRQTQRCGSWSWRPLASNPLCSRQSGNETWAVCIHDFHMGRA